MSTTLNYTRNPRTAILFPPGTIVITPMADDAFSASGEQPSVFILRHMTGDWGDLDEHDQQANATAVKHGHRIMSVYHLTTGVKIYVITEWDRSVTTILLPEDY